ncbi:hypothetical protein RFN30_26800 [Mesorhizobium sp. VK23D]|nr:hypothetical protein [Mesorhizobium sp. VK23D]MDX8521835.1 hypothetical protein [Mesorhizobium sp. VK23D]
MRSRAEPPSGPVLHSAPFVDLARQDRVDALNATRATVEEGIVADGSVALLGASLGITFTGANADLTAGIAIDLRLVDIQVPVRRALSLGMYFQWTAPAMSASQSFDGD